MSALPYFGDAYMADTRHLTLEEHGAYHLLLLIAWRSPNCALPADDKRLAQMLGITAKKWASLRPTVMAFWARTEHGFEQKRLTKERRWVEEKSRKNRAAAEALHRAKSLENNKQDDANADANVPANANANAHAPLPPPTLEKRTLAKASSRKPPLSYHRMPEGWQPSSPVPAPLQVKLAQWPPGAVEDEIAAFKRWAANAADQNGKGRKLDWDKALWNWLGREHDERYSRKPTGVTGLRGTRPNPALDLYRSACAEQDEEDHRGTGIALPAIGSG